MKSRTPFQKSWITPIFFASQATLYGKFDSKARNFLNCTHDLMSFRFTTALKQPVRTFRRSSMAFYSLSLNSVLPGIAGILGWCSLRNLSNASNSEYLFYTVHVLLFFQNPMTTLQNTTVALPSFLSEKDGTSMVIAAITFTFIAA